MPADNRFSWGVDWLTQAARPVAGPARSLHEAARRGGAAEARRWLGSVPADAFDGMGMTALSWAVARGNREAGAALLAAGANPWLARDRADMGAVYWAAALGRGDWFSELAARPGRPFAQWPGHFLTAALAGGNRAIIDHMLSEPHAQLRLSLDRPLPAADLFEPFLRDDPTLAGPLLFKAVELEARLDLVTLALAHGANANAQPQRGSGRDPPLVTAAHGFSGDSEVIVDALLRAGADPNMAGHWRRPLWTAIGTLHLDGQVDETDRRATAIFHRLLAAGADINLPNFQNRPQIWALLFPYGHSHRDLDASFVTPALLELLVRHELNLNARQSGERVLPLVEAQAGRNSELAVTLRRLGARR